jgi:hypothetical protein
MSLTLYLCAHAADTLSGGFKGVLAAISGFLTGLHPIGIAIIAVTTITMAAVAAWKAQTNATREGSDAIKEIIADLEKLRASANKNITGPPVIPEMTNVAQSWDDINKAIDEAVAKRAALSGFWKTLWSAPDILQSQQRAEDDKIKTLRGVQDEMGKLIYAYMRLTPIVRAYQMLMAIAGATMPAAQRSSIPFLRKEISALIAVHDQAMALYGETGAEPFLAKALDAASKIRDIQDQIGAINAKAAKDAEKLATEERKRLSDIQRIAVDAFRGLQAAINPKRKDENDWLNIKDKLIELRAARAEIERIHALFTKKIGAEAESTERERLQTYVKGELERIQTPVEQFKSYREELGKALGRGLLSRGDFIELLQDKLKGLMHGVAPKIELKPAFIGLEEMVSNVQAGVGSQNDADAAQLKVNEDQLAQLKLIAGNTRYVSYITE